MLVFWLGIGVSAAVKVLGGKLLGQYLPDTKTFMVVRTATPSRKKSHTLKWVCVAFAWVFATGLNAVACGDSFDASNGVTESGGAGGKTAAGGSGGASSTSGSGGDAGDSGGTGGTTSVGGGGGTGGTGGVGGQGGQCVYDANQGPLHYWPLDTSVGGAGVVDVIGSINGLATGSVTGEMGQVGQALGFNGNEYLKFGDVIDLGTQSFSIATWIYPKGSGGGGSGPGQRILTKGVTTFGTPPNAGYFVGLRDGMVEFWVHDGLNPVIASGDTPITIAWHHVVSVLDRTQSRISLYVDGSLQDEETFSTLNSLDTDIFFAIGALDYEPSSGNVAAFFMGSVDETAIFNRVLKACEVADLHQRGLNGQQIPIP